MSMRFVIAGIATVAALSAAAQDGDDLVIGTSLPLSGPNASAGQEGLATIKAQLDALNRIGGINGRKLQLVALDDAFDPQKAAANAQKLADSRAVAVLNCWGTASCSAMMPIITKAGMPLVAGIAGGGPMRLQPGKFAFNVRPNTEAEIARMVGQMKTVGQTRIAVIYQDDPFGKSGQAAAQAVLAKADLKATLELAVARDASNAPELLIALNRADVNGIILVAAPPATVRLVPALRKGGINAQVFNLAAQATRKLATDLGEHTRGMVFTTLVPSPWRDGVPVVREYQQAMSAASSGAEFSYLGLEVYLNTRVLLEGLRRAGRNATREGLVQALETMGPRSYGPMNIAYGPGDREGSAYVGLTIIGREGRFVE